MDNNRKLEDNNLDNEKLSNNDYEENDIVNNNGLSEEDSKESFDGQEEDSKNEEIEFVEENKTEENNEIRQTKKTRCLKQALILATVFALGGLSVFGAQGAITGLKTPQTSKVATTVQEEANEETTIKAVSKAKDAVVSVVSYASKKSSSNLSGIIGDKANKGELQAISNGSGVIYKKDGNTAYIVTNQHVINGAEKVDIILSDGTSVSAEIVGSDIWTDLTVLKVNSENIRVIMDFANSDNIAVGQTALAIGSPLGVSLSNSVTKGIVSAVERQIPIDIDSDGSYDWYQTVIQTDAAINPGNSGGALVNSSGELIGINELKISNATEGVSAEGIGFVIPANEVKIIVEQLEKNGKVDRPALGIQLTSVGALNTNLVEGTLNYDTSKKGVIIRSVESGSAASKAGLKEYDIIIKLNDTTIEGVADLRKYLFEKTKIGDTIAITYVRNGKEYTTELILGTLNQ